MNKGTFFSAITDIDDDLITTYGPESHDGERSSDNGVIGKRIRFLIPVAACVCIALLAGVVIMAKSERTQKKNIVVITNANATAGPEANEGLMYQMFHYSDNIVKGEVLDFLEEVHSNPSGEDVNKDGNVITLAMIAKYSFRVDEVIVGDLEPGDIITIGITNHTGYSYEFLQNNVVINETTEYGYLEAGQSGIFFLCSDGRFQKASDTDKLYMTHETGIFDKVNEDGLYVSRRFTIDPAEIPELKVKAEEYWSGRQRSAISLKPDILIDVAFSDTILRGEVLEVLGEEHANPDGTHISKSGDPIPLALVTRYRFRVDEVYRSRDDISVGDVITVATVYDVFVTEDSLDKIETDPDNPPYYLHEGQNGIFFFVTDLTRVPDGADSLLFLRHSGVVFDSVDENGIYHSTLFDLDPADLPEMYAEAEEKWGSLGK